MAYLKYTTIEKLKAYLPAVTLTDTQFAELITRGSKLLDSELGNNLGEQTITKRIDGYGKAKLVFENRITSVESIEHYDQGSWRTIKIEHIQGAIAYTESIIPSGDSNVRITYTKGYQIIPEDIQIFFHYYCVKLLSLDSYMQGNRNGEVVSKKINGLSISYKTPSEIIESLTTQGGVFEQSFKNILDTYKNFTLGIA